MYKSIEEITLNTWPAEQSVVMNGWILRTASGYTKRANSVNPLYGAEESYADTLERIKLAELYYENAGLQPVFKITPFIQPANLDDILADRGYAIVQPSSVRLLDLEQLTVPESGYSIQIQDKLSIEWLDAFTELDELSQEKRNTLTRMLSASHLQQGYALLLEKGIPISCGFGVIQQGYIGIYDIVTAPLYRRQGKAKQLLLELLLWGRSQGASSSFLQVVQNNHGASALYDQLGYKEIYQYWYRVQS